MAHINNIPDELLRKIFKFYLKTETQRHFIQNVSYVCRRWNDVAKDSSLYHRVDGSLPLQNIVDLAAAGALVSTKTLKFGRIHTGESDWHNPSRGRSEHFKTIYENIPKLRCLDLSNTYDEFNMQSESHAIFTELEGMCPDLSELILSRPELSFPLPMAIFSNTLKVRGSNFVKLDFSGPFIPGLIGLMHLIADFCPNLEELLAQTYMNESEVLLHRFPTCVMQQGLRKLKTLRLGPPMSIGIIDPDEVVGFPNLEIFSFPTSYNERLNSSHLEALVGKSPNLKILDIRGWASVNVDAVLSLPARNLENLYLARTHVLESNYSTNLFKKWCHSLKVVDLSFTDGILNYIFQHINFPNNLPKVMDLDMSCTLISDETVYCIIKRCPELQYLNVESCENLKFVARKFYDSKLDIEDLLWMFHNYMEIDTDLY